MNAQFLFAFFFRPTPTKALTFERTYVRTSKYKSAVQLTDSYVSLRTSPQHNINGLLERSSICRPCPMYLHINIFVCRLIYICPSFVRWSIHPSVHPSVRYASPVSAPTLLVLTLHLYYHATTRWALGSARGWLSKTYPGL